VKIGEFTGAVAGTRSTQNLGFGAAMYNGGAFQSDLTSLDFYYAASPALTDAEELLLSQEVDKLCDIFNRHLQHGIILVGDSITAGVGASDNDHRYSTVLANLLNCTETNWGVSQSVLQNTSPAPGSNMITNLDSRVQLYDGITDWYMNFYGVNDIRFFYPAWTKATFKTAYETFIQYAHNTRGWPYSKIICCSPIYQVPELSYYNLDPGGGAQIATVERHEEHVAAVQEIATQYGCKYIDTYTYTKNNGGALWLADGIHPNDLGCSEIANYIFSEL